MSNSWQPHRLQHARLPWPSLSPGVCSNSCSLSWWCHPTILSSVVPFSSCSQSFPALESFPMSWLFTSGKVLELPWDYPDKNTGVGCHFLLQCMKLKSESEVAQSCPTLSDPMDCSLPGSIHGIFQARVLEWGAIAFSEKGPNHLYNMEREWLKVFRRSDPQALGGRNENCGGWESGLRAHF